MTMKNIKRIFAASVLGSAMIFTTNSCEKIKDFKDTNVNPNGSSSALTSALLTNVEANLGGISTTLLPGQYCQYFTEANYPGASRYSIPQINSSGTYSGILEDCQQIIDKNSDPAQAGTSAVISGGSNKNQIAVAKILKSYIFWTVTDRWGDMPYTEALKGVNFLSPKYDDQQVIYTGLLADLKSALTDFDGGVNVKGDIIFAGDVSKWRKFANSLRMLISIRMSKVFPAAGGFAALQFNDALTNTYGYIQTNADNFSIAYPGGNYRNPWNTLGASPDNAVAKTFTDALTGLGDNRLSSMASNSNGAAYGLPSAAPTSPPLASILAPTFRTEASTLVIINAASVLLAKAEAIELGWVTGQTTTDAQTAYNAAVTASFAQWNQPLPGTYLTTGLANYTSGAGVTSIGGSSVVGSNALTTSKLARIALQQWIAFYPDGIQGWSNWRRSEYINAVADRGVPDIRPAVNNLSSSGKIPRRFTYGTTEYSLNKAQLDKAIAKLVGGDTQDARMWWDKKP